MKKAPTFMRTSSDELSLTVFSNNRILSWHEQHEIFLLVSWPESANEPPEVARKRTAFNSRVDSWAHLNAQGLPASVDSYDYEILKLKGMVK